MKPIAQWEKDPDSTMDYGVDWSEVFPSDAIATTVTTVPVGLTLVSQSNTATVHTFRLSGGTVNQSYLVTSRVTTASGQTDERTVEIIVVQR